MARSNFSPTGLNLGDNTSNMTYLYGLSDFFSVMFENTERVNLLLEAESEVAAGAYSKFLQMTSTISLEEIQNTLGETIKLITIRSTDAIQGEVNTYALPASIVSSRYISNRPLLPTSLLEQGVDYRIEEPSSGVFQIRLAKDLSQSGFSTRLLADGSNEYALWFVDTEIDERWISDYYGDLIGVNPESSTDAFRNFVYGLYYIYANGPTLDLIRKGLNLCLGVPLARETETVLEIRKYLETDQSIVITDQNQYLIPFGIDPSVVEGQQLKVSDELALWVEVKDFLNDGDWWINLLIPPSVIPHLPDGQKDRYATAGSHFDYLMRNYLRKHTFLVNVKVKDFKQNQIFQQLSDIIRRVKPSYTQAIYIWTIPSSNLEETLTITDTLTRRMDQFRCENLSYGMDKFYRGNSLATEVASPVTSDFSTPSSTAMKRGCPTFIRYNVPHWITKLCGANTYVNGNSISALGGIADGFINPVTQYRNNTSAEKAWLRTINERGSETLLRTRSKIGFTRGTHSLLSPTQPTASVDSYALDYERLYTLPTDVWNNWGLPPIADLTMYWTGVPAHPIYSWAKIPAGMKVLPMYLTTQTDLIAKCAAAGIGTPDLSEWTFSLFNTFNGTSEIDENPIDVSKNSPTDLPTLISSYSTFSTRGTGVGYLSNLIPQLGLRQWAPPGGAGDLLLDDYLIGVRVHDNVVGIYLVTGNPSLVSTNFYPVEEIDPLEVSFNTRPTRGVAPSTLSPYYTIRGRGTVSSATNNAMIDGSMVNSGVSTTLDTSYTDSINLSSTAYLRNIDPVTGTKLNHLIESK